MIYCNNELKADGFDHIIAMQRYLYKYINHKKEFHRLKAHEKDYAFGWMNATYDDKGKKAFNLYEDVEAYEYVFFNIILTYGEDIASFEGEFFGPSGKILNRSKNCCLVSYTAMECSFISIIKPSYILKRKRANR